MSFNQLNKDELTEVVEFFAKDVEPGDPEKGPSKKELLAALASGDKESDTDAPVTWKEYNEIFLPAQNDKKVAPKAPELADTDAAKKLEDVSDEEVEEVEEQLVFFTGLNPRLDMAGFTFTKDHPFNSVPVEVAEYLVKTGLFRPAMPSEVADFYN